MTTLPINYKMFPATSKFGLMYDVDKFGVAYRNIVSHDMFKEKFEYVHSHYKKLGFSFCFIQTNEKVVVKIIAPQMRWWRIITYYPWVHWAVSQHRLEELRGEYTNKTGNFLPKSKAVADDDASNRRNKVCSENEECGGY